MNPVLELRLDAYLGVDLRLRQLSTIGVDSRGLRKTDGDGIFDVNTRSSTP